METKEENKNNNEIEFERLSNDNNTFHIKIKRVSNNSILISCKNKTSIPNLVFENSFSFDDLKKLENFKENNSIQEIFENFRKIIDIKAEKNILEIEKDKKILLKFKSKENSNSNEFELIQVDRPSEEVVKELIELVKSFIEKSEEQSNRINQLNNMLLNYPQLEDEISKLKNEIKFPFE